MTTAARIRIDAHHHVWDLATRPQPWTAELPTLWRSFFLDELAPALTRNSIDKTVLVQTAATTVETRELLALAAAANAVCGVVGWIDLTADTAASELAGLRESLGGDRLVGVRHQVQVEPDATWLSRPDVRNGLSAVASAGLAYDLLIRGDQIAAALDTARRLPQLRFVLDHAVGPVAGRSAEEWTEQVAGLAALQNVTLKLSGFASDPHLTRYGSEVLQRSFDSLLNSFGPGRLMFGSDWPACLLSNTYDGTIRIAEELTATLSVGERAEIFGGTAASFYGLSV
jgi:L-fuconolactonase